MVGGTEIGKHPHTFCIKSFIDLPFPLRRWAYVTTDDKLMEKDLYPYFVSIVKSSGRTTNSYICLISAYVYADARMHFRLAFVRRTYTRLFKSVR